MILQLDGEINEAAVWCIVVNMPCWNQWNFQVNLVRNYWKLSRRTPPNIVFKFYQQLFYISFHSWTANVCVNFGSDFSNNNTYTPIFDANWRENTDPQLCLFLLSPVHNPIFCLPSSSVFCFLFFLDFEFFLFFRSRSSLMRWVTENQKHNW